MSLWVFTWADVSFHLLQGHEAVCTLLLVTSCALPHSSAASNGNGTIKAIHLLECTTVSYAAVAINIVAKIRRGTPETQNLLWGS